MIEADLDKQWVRGGMRSRRGCLGWTRWIQKETLMRENWKFGRRRDWDEVWEREGVNDGGKDNGFGLGTI